MGAIILFTGSCYRIEQAVAPFTQYFSICSRANWCCPCECQLVLIICVEGCEKATHFAGLIARQRKCVGFSRGPHLCQSYSICANQHQVLQTARLRQSHSQRFFLPQQSSLPKSRRRPHTPFMPFGPQRRWATWSRAPSR